MNIVAQIRLWISIFSLIADKRKIWVNRHTHTLLSPQADSRTDSAACRALTFGNVGSRLRTTSGRFSRKCQATRHGLSHPESHHVLPGPSSRCKGPSWVTHAWWPQRSHRSLMTSWSALPRVQTWPCWWPPCGFRGCAGRWPYCCGQIGPAAVEKRREIHVG